MKSALTALALVALAACLDAVSSAGAHPGALAACRSKQLLVVSSSAGAAAGTSYLSLIFINRGARCSLVGYPGVSAVRYGARDPVQVGPPARREDPFSVGTGRAVVLQRNGTASSALSQVDALNYPAARCHPEKADALRIYPPNEHTPIVVGVPVEVCRRRATMGISPVEPGVPRALQSSG